MRETNKAPADQFYFDDFYVDLSEHPLEIVGAWALILCKLWKSDTRGKLKKTLTQWSRILGVDSTRALSILIYIKSEKIGDIPENLTDSNANITQQITVICRRQVRDEKKRENNRIRQRKYYEKHKDDAEPNAPPNGHRNSTSSSTSTTNTNNSTPEASDAALWNFAKDLEEHFPDIKKFVGRMKKLKHSDEGIAHALNRFKEESGKGNNEVLENPWGFCLTVLKGDEGKVSARLSEKEHYERICDSKKKAPELIKQIMGRVG